MTRNEEKSIYGKRWDRRWAAAWRAPERGIPDWRVYVQFGDDGDPGVYGESLETAVQQVATALSELESLYTALREFQAEQEWG